MHAEKLLQTKKLWLLCMGVGHVDHPSCAGMCCVDVVQRVVCTAGCVLWTSAWCTFGPLWIPSNAYSRSLLLRWAAWLGGGPAGKTQW
jgi:hypothetical protein